MSAEHSPAAKDGAHTPFEIKRYGGETKIYDADRTLVAHIYSQQPTAIVAAFIVEACNSHATLKEQNAALREALENTERLAYDLIKRTSEIDAKLIKLGGNPSPCCELGEITRLREQMLNENRAALAQSQSATEGRQ